MSVASVVLFNRYALSGNGDLGKKLSEAFAAAPVHGGRKYVELIIDGSTGKFLEVLSHSPARVFEECIKVARAPQKYGATATILTLIFDAARYALLDIALIDPVAAKAYEALTALPEQGASSTRFAA